MSFKIDPNDVEASNEMLKIDPMPFFSLWTQTLVFGQESRTTLSFRRPQRRLRGPHRTRGSSRSWRPHERTKEFEIFEILESSSSRKDCERADGRLRRVAVAGLVEAVEDW